MSLKQLHEKELQYGESSLDFCLKELNKIIQHKINKNLIIRSNTHTIKELR